MIKYRTKLIEKNTHGGRGGSYLIKTFSELTPPPPIACVPFGMLTFTLGGLMPQLETDYGPQSDSYEMSPMSLDGVIGGGDGMVLEPPLNDGGLIVGDGGEDGVVLPVGGPSLTMSVNDGPFVTTYLDDPYDAISIIFAGNPDVKTIPVGDISPATVATNLFNNTSMSFVIGSMIALEYMQFLDEPLAMYLMQMHLDVFGYELTNLTNPEEGVTGVIGLNSRGEMVGKTNNWSLLELQDSVLSNIPTNPEMPPITLPQMFVEERETKVTYKRTEQPGDLYSALFNNPDENELTVTSCSVIEPEAPTYTCIPTVRAFSPTVGVELNDGNAAFVVRMRVDISLGSDGYITQYVNRVITTLGMDGNFGSLGPGVQMYYLDPEASAVDVFKMLFGVYDPETEGSSYDATLIGGVSGIGESSNSINLISDYNPTTNQATIAGIFDEMAIEPPPQYGISYTTKYPHWRNVNANSSVTRITLEKVDPEMLPYYAKCYITEQFGEEIVLDSCLSLYSGGFASNV